MSRTYRVSQRALWERGRVVKTEREEHSGECFMCGVGKRPRRLRNKARRRFLKKQLRLEQDSGE